MEQWGGRKAQRLRRAVLDTYGTVCHLCGRDGADTADHLVPRSQGGTDTLDNLRPAHARCNYRRGDRPAPGHGANVVVVTGPPGAGKTTWIAEHAEPDDITIDLDRLAVALQPTNERPHDYPGHVRHVAIGAREAALDRASRLRESVTVYLVHSLPSLAQLDSYRGRGWSVVSIDPGADVTLDRLAGRAERARAAAEAYYRGEPTHAPSTHTTRTRRRRARDTRREAPPRASPPPGWTEW